MSGQRILVRTSDDYVLTDHLWLGEMAFNTTTGSLAHNNGVYTSWGPEIDETTDSYVLRQDTLLRGIDRNGNLNTVALELQRVDGETRVIEPISDDFYIKIDATRAVYGEGPRQIENYGFPAPVWNCELLPTPNSVETFIALGSANDVVEKHIEGSNLLAWASTVISTVGIDLVRSSDKDFEHRQLMTKHSYVGPNAYHGLPMSAAPGISMEQTGTDFHLGKLGFRTFIRDLNILQSPLHIYALLMFKVPSAYMDGTGIYFKSRVGFGTKFKVTSHHIASGEEEGEYFYTPYDPDDWTEAERTSGPLIVDIVYDVVDTSADTSTTFIRFAGAWGYETKQPSPKTLAYSSYGDAMSQALAQASSVQTKTITMYGTEASYFNFNQRMADAQYDIVIESSPYDITIESQDEFGFTISSSLASATENWAVTFNVVSGKSPNYFGSI